MALMPFNIRAFPAIIVTLVFAALSLLRGHELSSQLTLQILFILHPLYYWGVFRPSLFPAWFAFLIGFAIDLNVGRLLGLNAFLLVFVSLVVGRQQRYLRSQPFATQWAGFFMVCMGAEAVRWLIMGGVTMAMFSPLSALLSGLCNAALYPLTVLVMGPCIRVLSRQFSQEKLHD